MWKCLQKIHLTFTKIYQAQQWQNKQQGWKINTSLKPVSKWQVSLCKDAQLYVSAEIYKLKQHWVLPPTHQRVPKFKSLTTPSTGEHMEQQDSHLLLGVQNEASTWEVVWWLFPTPMSSDRVTHMHALCNFISWLKYAPRMPERGHLPQLLKIQHLPRCLSVGR